MSDLAHTVAEFAVAAAIGTASVIGGVAVSAVGLVFKIAEHTQARALKQVQADHQDRFIAVIAGYWARKGLSTPTQNETAITEFVATHGGTAWIVRWPHEGFLLLWHYSKDFQPKKGSALYISSIARGTQSGNEWATNP